MFPVNIPAKKGQGSSVFFAVSSKCSIITIGKHIEFGKPPIYIYTTVVTRSSVITVVKQT